MKHIKYPKIGQFRNIVTSINRECTFTSVDENGDGIYDNTLPKPTLTFKGTTKLHGTNSGICYNEKDGFWVQSRENIITTKKDNAGFAFFAESHREIFMDLLNKVIEDNKIDTNILTVSIFGEWVGKGIQKGVGISEIDKSFFIFAAKISKQLDPDFKSYWVDIGNLRNKGAHIYNIEDYETFSIDIDFGMPQLIQNKLIELTEEVERECPVAKSFGISGFGEGIVWTTTYKGNTHRMKIKGKKHSVSKVKTLASVDIEKLNSINEFVDYAVTKNRFNQAIDNVFGSIDNLDIKKMGDLIRWVVKDVTTEEMDTMVQNNLVPKDVNKYISNKTRQMFFEYNNF